MLRKDKLGVLFAEFFGTALLAGSVLAVSNMFGLGTAPWYISLTAGITLAIIVGMIGHVSGAHVNPAVTIGLASAKKMPLITAILYIVFQMLGGASALLFYNYASGETLANEPGAYFAWPVFAAEAVGALIFGMGIAAAVSQKMEGLQLSLMIGLSLTIGALVASVGAAGFLNPAVALANNSLDWTYALAPVVGMVVGMNTYFWLFTPSRIKSKKK